MRHGTGWTREAPQRTVMQSAYCPICRVRIFFQPKGSRSDEYSEEPIACSPAHAQAVRANLSALLKRWLDAQPGDRDYWCKLHTRYWYSAIGYGLIDEDVARWAQEDLRRGAEAKDAGVLATTPQETR